MPDNPLPYQGLIGILSKPEDGTISLITDQQTIVLRAYVAAQFASGLFIASMQLMDAMGLDPMALLADADEEEKPAEPTASQVIQ